jgi:ketosteroid isomerase-like protein
LRLLQMIYLGTMRTNSLPSCLASMLILAPALLSVVVCGAARAQGTGGDEKQIRVILQKYAISVDSADVSLASEIWSQDPSVTFIHPLGTEHGFKQIADHVYIGMMAGMFSKRELILHEPNIHVYRDAAWSEMTWTFHATTKDGSAITTEGRETQVYHKEHGVWRIVLVHYSGPAAAMPSAPNGN